jgi:hypothetical protein|eukprot:COSAG06_NODE_203_length_20332_cov_14.679978_12_plen_82_part_00
MNLLYELSDCVFASVYDWFILFALVRTDYMDAVAAGGVLLVSFGVAVAWIPSNCVNAFGKCLKVRVDDKRSPVLLFYILEF